MLFMHFRLTIQATKALIDKDLSVSKQSSLILMKLAIRRDGNNQIVLFKDPINEVLKESLTVKDDALKLRVLDLMIKVSALSEEHLER